MRAQMYCIKHIELNADMEKNNYQLAPDLDIYGDPIGPL